MNQIAKRILFSLMAMVILLAACAPAPAATQDPALVQQLIEQSVQLTVAAQNLETAQAVPPATETPLPAPTEVVPPTPTPIIPSATPFVVVPPTTVVSGGGGGGTTVKPEYACDIIHQRPFDNEKFAKGDDFDIRWTFVNIGTKPWRAGSDLKYSYGPQMTTTTLLELPEIAPGAQYEVILDATAPTEAGTQTMVWSLEGVYCTPYVSIIVK
jgi:hypothetical protein